MFQRPVTLQCPICEKPFVVAGWREKIAKFCSRKCKSTQVAIGRFGPQTIEARFWPRVVRGSHDACWPWTGEVNGAGYGQFVWKSSRVMSHRFAYAELVGPIPKGQFVCHKCDNPPCVNPNHLFLGDYRDNANDMAFKARGHFSKLTGEQAMEIKRRLRAGEKRRDLANQFGVSKSAVGHIARGYNWKFLPPA